MLLIYRLCFLPVLLLALPYYAWRMIRRGGYRHDFNHRFGLMDRPPLKPEGVKRIWIQAVSVGELKAIGPLLETLSRNKAVEVVLTTTTSTGYRLARDTYGRLIQKIGVFPIDFFPFSRSAWRRIDPDLAILMEGELWPEHLAQAEARSVPVVLINARLSDRSFRRYRKFQWVANSLIEKLSAILCSSDGDAQRFQKLGADPEQVKVTGNLKFDVAIEPWLTPEASLALRQEIGLEGVIDGFPSLPARALVLLGSSTWPGEEAMLLELLEESLAGGVNARLLLVPRHAERRGEIISLLQAQGLPWHLRSSKKQSERPVAIYVGDTTGELAMLSQAADLVFVGKSLPPHEGGQTPIEAGALGLPMVYGPNMSNFRQVCRSLETAGVAQKAKDAGDAKQHLFRLLQDAEARQQMAEAAHGWHQQNQGATERTLKALEAYTKL